MLYVGAGIALMNTLYIAFCLALDVDYRARDSMAKFFRGIGRVIPVIWGGLKNALQIPFAMRASEREQYRAVILSHKAAVERLEAELRYRETKIKAINAEIKRLSAYVDRKSSIMAEIEKLDKEAKSVQAAMETYHVYAGDRAEPIYTYVSNGEATVHTPSRRYIEPKPAMCAMCGDVPLETDEAFHMHLPNGMPATFPKGKPHVRTVAKLSQMAGPNDAPIVKGVDAEISDPMVEDIDAQISRLRTLGDVAGKAVAMVRVEPEPPTHAQYGDAWLPTISEPETHRCDGCGVRMKGRGMCEDCSNIWQCHI